MSSSDLIRKYFSAYENKVSRSVRSSSDLESCRSESTRHISSSHMRDRLLV
jgi:hypothetical protein